VEVDYISQKNVRQITEVAALMSAQITEVAALRGKPDERASGKRAGEGANLPGYGAISGNYSPEK
jgi:hypothetical protein